MPTNKLSALYGVQRQLRTESFHLYEKTMYELFQNHEKHDFTHILKNFFRSKRYDLALRFADSLSEQKYADAATHFAANQFALLIRKYPWNPKVVQTDPESKAIKTFMTAERKCFLLNRKFVLYDNYRSPIQGSLSAMRSFIRYVIGDSPNISKILDSGAFGSGASLGVHGNATHLSRKILSEKWTVTPGAYTYGYWAMMRNPQLRELFSERRGSIFCRDDDASYRAFKAKTHVVANNKISFVPKTASTHRAIAVEPLLNGYLQKGTDVVMRNALRRIGIDLSDQSLNQRLAREGSIDGSTDNAYSTIDLSSASDSISIGLARSLLPPDWFDFLNSIRSTEYELNGKRYVYSKFCSMGNGFCFPLESLIFAACCHASGCGKPGTDFSVYGDDIIVRGLHAKGVLSLLKAIGFSPNADKTFLSGPFRESCGSDWFGGVDVRPYTLDHALDSLEACFKWLNLTKRNQFTIDFFSGTSTVLGAIPEQFRFWRPFKGNPDSGIDSLGGEHLTSPNCFFHRKEQIWYCKALRHVPISDKRRHADSSRQAIADMYSLLSGTASSPRYGVDYTFRRKTRATVTFTGVSGATSMWLPGKAFGGPSS
jgi:hypothetical protein